MRVRVAEEAAAGVVVAAVARLRIAQAAEKTPAVLVVRRRRCAPSGTAPTNKSRDFSTPSNSRLIASCSNTNSSGKQNGASLEAPFCFS